MMHVEGGAALDDTIHHFYDHTVGSYWPPERRLVEDGYRNLPFPFRETNLPSPAIEASWCLADIIGYVNTWSAVKAATADLKYNPVVPFEQRLREAWGDPHKRYIVTWPLSARVGHV